MIRELSIVIPTLNEEKYLPKLLRSLSEQDFDGKLQIIVVDGHSTDKTVAVAQTFSNVFSDFTVTRKTRGVSHQRNEGARLAAYEHILFIDADALLPSTCLRHIAYRADLQKPIVATAMHLPVKPNTFDYLFAAAVQTYLLLAWAWHPITPGSFMLTRKSIHEKIEGFDERLVFAEDIDYGQRAIEAGAVYRFFLWPYVLSSPRRLRKMGRLPLIFFWLKNHLRIAINGPIYDASHLSYPTGNHTSDE